MEGFTSASDLSSALSATDYANAARKASLPASATFVGEMASSPAPVAEATATTAKGGKKHTDRKGSESAEDVTAHLEAPAVQETVVSDAKQSTPQTESGSTPATTAPPAATAAAQSSLATAVSPSTASESAVESFTFGSVVAPVVTTTDKAAMQFGTAASATRGAAAALAVASAAETAAPPSSSSSTAATISAKPEAGNQHNTAGIRDDTPAHPLQPAAWPQAGASKPAAAADTGKTIAWGAKKSFADVRAYTEYASGHLFRVQPDAIRMISLVYADPSAVGSRLTKGRSISVTHERAPNHSKSQEFWL